MVKAGIVDPTKVVRLELHGASVAGLLITTKVLVVEKPDRPAGKSGYLTAATLPPDQRAGWKSRGVTESPDRAHH